MNKYNRQPRGILELCPKCGRDSGERKASVSLPTRYFVRCASCGYIVGADNQSTATRKWNMEGRNEQEKKR